MGRDAGGHAHRDASTAVQQQKRQLCRQDRRFLLGPIEVGSEIDRVVADLIEQCLMSDRCQSRFGVTHCGRWVIVHGTEVAMAIQQRMAAGKGLDLSDQRVVDRLITVRVIFTENVPDDAGAFAIRAIRCEPKLVHRVQDAALNWFETVADIRQGPTHDHAHRVLEIGALHLVMQGDRLNALLGHPLRNQEGRRRLAYRSSF